MAYGWEGQKVRLVPLDKARHLDNAVQWLNDPEVTHNLLIGDMPLTRPQEEGWFDASSGELSSDIRFAIETLDGQHIGFSGLHGVNYRHGFSESGTVIGDKSFWGNGYGTDAARTRARYAFEVLGLRMLLSGCLEGNERSYGMLKKVGYQEYGRLPQHFWKRGRYVDHILMVLHRENWLKLPG